MGDRRVEPFYVFVLSLHPLEIGKIIFFLFKR